MIRNPYLIISKFLKDLIKNIMAASRHQAMYSYFGIIVCTTLEPIDKTIEFSVVPDLVKTGRIQSN